MGNYQSISKINYEDLNNLINNNKNDYVLINTLNVYNQKCLIINTLQYVDEEKVLNKALNENKSLKVVIYGANYSDDSIYKKYIQLLKLGFDNVHIYPGGMFEWLLLQDTYGNDNFITTSKELDILKFKPISSELI
tara:strand:+ start:3760 stop:4167 length:408 start_codon:yes stop_codon:yes gene_type:complete